MKWWDLHDSDYTIFDSMSDSVRFAVERTLLPYGAHIYCKSSFVDCFGRVMEWHDFGTLEGPGWAANAVGGAYEIYWYAEHVADRPMARKALLLLDHVLEDGFVNYDTGFVVGYRDTRTNRFCLNFKHNNRWFCPGSMAKIGYQMLVFADLLGKSRRAEKMRAIARQMAGWIAEHVKVLDNGWYPRRCRPDGRPFPWDAWGGNRDPQFKNSGDGLFIVQLMVGLSERGMADYGEEIRRRIKAFMAAGGMFGSINHDTYDNHENVSYAVGFRVLRAAAGLLEDEDIRRFAYDKCLAGLDQFKMREDRNGVKTKGLLWMERSWDTSYMWENAEAALAYVEAFEETGERKFREEAFTILHAISKHHHGPYGFLTEGVDWNNHVGRKHHFWRAKYGDIRYTEPLLNNLHITEPTLHLMRLWPELEL